MSYQAHARLIYGIKLTDEDRKIIDNGDFQDKLDSWKKGEVTLGYSGDSRDELTNEVLGVFITDADEYGAKKSR